MPRCKSFTAAVLGGALFTAAAIAQGTFAQDTGRWTTGMPMPSSRTEIAVAEVDGKIYVVGGFRGERELEIYDPSTDRWSRGASIPRAVHHAGAAGERSGATREWAFGGATRDLLHHSPLCCLMAH